MAAETHTQYSARRYTDPVSQRPAGTFPFSPSPRDSGQSLSHLMFNITHSGSRKRRLEALELELVNECVFNGNTAYVKLKLKP